MEEEKKRLTREEMLARRTLKTEDVELSDGSLVTVRELTAMERDELETSQVIERGGKVIVDKENLRAKLICRTCMYDGKQMFTEDDVEAIGRIGAADIDRLYAAAERLSGMGVIAIKERLKN
jgi:hypothetical protein